MSSLLTLEPIPTSPVSAEHRPEAYQAFSKLISHPDITGVGANVWDLEIFRLACLEKVQRDGPLATTESGFVLNFLANICAPWARGRVTFWHEGLGYGWNVMVVDCTAIDLLDRVLFRPDSEIQIFSFSAIPAHLPGYDCDIYQDYTVCRYNANASKLTADERAVWQRAAEERNRGQWTGKSNAIRWGDEQ
jgi:hypothetical protein